MSTEQSGDLVEVATFTDLDALKKFLTRLDAKGITYEVDQQDPASCAPATSCASCAYLLMVPNADAEAANREIEEEEAERAHGIEVAVDEPTIIRATALHDNSPVLLRFTESSFEIEDKNGIKKFAPEEFGTFDVLFTEGPTSGQGTGGLVVVHGLLNMLFGFFKGQAGEPARIVDGNGGVIYEMRIPGEKIKSLLRNLNV